VRRSNRNRRTVSATHAGLRVASISIVTRTTTSTPPAHVVGREQLAERADPRARRHGRRKAHLVQPRFSASTASAR
jgi:hypothetical protein